MKKGRYRMPFELETEYEGMNLYATFNWQGVIGKVEINVPVYTKEWISADWTALTKRTRIHLQEAVNKMLQSIEAAEDEGDL